MADEEAFHDVLAFVVVEANVANSIPHGRFRPHVVADDTVGEPVLDRTDVRLALAGRPTCPSTSTPSPSPSVYLVQELDSVARPGLLWGPNGPATDSARLRDIYESWVTSVIRERVSRSLRCREKVKRRAGRTRSDEEVLSRWLAVRNDEFPRWIQQFGSGQEWDFSLDILDALEALIRRVASGPE